MASFINSETDEIITWKYIISELTLIFPTWTKDIPVEKVTEFSIDNDYEKNLFPITKINMQLEPDVYKSMVDAKNDLKIKIRLQKYYTKKGSSEKSLLRDCFNTTFNILLDDNFTNPDRDLEMRKALNTGVTENSQDTLDYKKNSKMEFFLYNDSTLQAARKMANAVLSNTSMIGAITYLCSISNMTKLLISPLENNEVYKELLIPPQTILSAFQYFDTEYGFYKKGSIIYFGVDKGYILNYKGGCTAYEKDEIQETCILIPKKGGEQSASEGMVEKPDQGTKRKYIVVSATNVNIEESSISNDIISGNNATIVNTNTNSIMSTSGGTIQKGKGNYNLISTNSFNKWLGEVYAAQQSANTAVISLSCGDFDYESINPNKKFSIIFEDTLNNEKYRGVYNIAKSTLKFVKSGSDFELDGSMVFKKADVKGSTVSSEELSPEEKKEDI